MAVVIPPQAGDYLHFLPGLQVGLGFRRQREDERRARVNEDLANDAFILREQEFDLQKRRQAEIEQDGLARRIRETEMANRIARTLEAEADYQKALQAAVATELRSLGDSSDPAAKEEAMMRAYKSTMHMLPVNMIPGAFGGEAGRDAMLQRLQLGNTARMDQLEQKLASQEWIAELKADAISKGRAGRAISEDEFVNRHLNGHASRSGVSSKVADAQLREIYRSSRGGSTDDLTVTETDPVLDTLQQLMRAKDAGMKYGKVTPGGDFKEASGPMDRMLSGTWFGDDSVDELIAEYEKRAKVKGLDTGRGSAPKGDETRHPAPKGRVFKFNPKTGKLD